MHVACFVVTHPIALNAYVFFECTLMFSLRMKHAGETLCVRTQANTAKTVLFCKCVQTL